ncbi:MAG: sigma-54 dependent transcriptional regulator [Candidatus Competibacteraceae bacterium]
MDERTALIVDDEADILELIEMTLTPMGIQCLKAANLAQAKDLLQQQPFSFCLTDMRLPDGNGLELVGSIQKSWPNLPVAVITAYGNVESAVEALKLGAFDFVSKPFELEVLRTLIETALKLAAPTEERAEVRPLLLGNSPAMQSVLALIRRLARSQAPVLISGESGTGKELAARLIHGSGPRADKPFVPINCGAIPEHLMESEFFGYKKGSFTGATQDKAGLFQAAHGGTLFLDEVAELPQHMQVKLLRAIQERAVRPIGTQTELAMDVRILSATHKDLSKLVDEGTFRQDLFYRLNVIELRLPSLRERPDDIPPLANHILERLGHHHGLTPPRLTPAALEELCHYAFPGNVRELENILERVFTLCDSPWITPTDLHLPEPTTSPVWLPEPPEGLEPNAEPVMVTDLEGYLEDLEREAITKALEATRYNKTAAAEKLGISFRALRYRLKKLGLD